MIEIDYDKLRVAAHDFKVANAALELALKNHPEDKYLHGQCREHIWTKYWELREAAGDRPEARPETIIAAVRNMRRAHPMGGVLHEDKPYNEIVSQIATRLEARFVKRPKE